MSHRVVGFDIHTEHPQQVIGFSKNHRQVANAPASRIGWSGDPLQLQLTPPRATPRNAGRARPSPNPAQR